MHGRCCDACRARVASELAAHALLERASADVWRDHVVAPAVVLARPRWSRRRVPGLGHAMATAELFARSFKLNLGQIGAARREARVSHVKRCFDRPSNDITTTRYRNSELSITVAILVVLTVSLPQYQYWPAIYTQLTDHELEPRV